MKFPCELIAEPYIATIRIIAAHELTTRGLSQSAIAKLLQISQPVVSGYLKKQISRFDEEDPIRSQAMEIGRQVAEILLNEGLIGTEKAIALGCKTCKILRQPGPICALHKSHTSHLSNSCTSCHTQTSLIQLQTNKQFVLIELKDFYNSLLNFDKLEQIIPEIGLQIAFSTQNPLGLYDIAAFPGRIIKRKGRVPIADPPMFGSSETTSDLLLKLRRKHEDIRSIVTLKTTSWLDSRIKKQPNITYCETTDFDVATDKVLGSIDIQHLPFALIDKGSLGFEAITYICAGNLDQLFSEVLQPILT